MSANVARMARQDEVVLEAPALDLQNSYAHCPLEVWTVRQTGSPPLRFKGRLISEATRSHPLGYSSVSIRIFSRMDERILISVDVQSKLLGPRGLAQFTHTNGLEDAVCYLEEFDLLAAVQRSVDEDDSLLSASEHAIQCSTNHLIEHDLMMRLADCITDCFDSLEV